MPRGRLSHQERKAKTRAAILTAASRLFARRGIEATSLDDIARAIGFTKGAIYASFPSKRALVDAVVERHEVPVDLDPLWRADRPLADRLAEMGRSVAERCRTIPRETLMLDLEYRLDWLRNPRRRERERQRLLALWDEVSRRMVAANATRGEATPVDPKELIVALTVLGAGLMRTNAEFPGTLTDAGIETVFRLLAGMRPSA